MTTQANTAMNNNLRVRPRMTIGAIKRAATQQGYKYKSNTRCPVCEEEMLMAVQAVGYTDTTPVWVNTLCAGKFYKKGKPILIACPCGYRSTMVMNFKNNKKTCAIDGCNHLVSDKDPGGICFPCRHEIEGGGNPAMWAPECQYRPEGGCFHFLNVGIEACEHCTPPLICKTKTCNNPVPRNRKAYCHGCVPPTAKKVQEPRM